jgi:glycosyltransferase involved in cell wall biosynthesis
MMSIPASVIITVKNEAARIGRCLAALKDFDEVIVVDSGSADGTAALAQKSGATVVQFHWNGQYPKKRQWCLDTLRLKNDWIFFVDADEIVTPELSREIAKIFEDGPTRTGYFVPGRYSLHGKTLRFGLVNNKLVLFDRRLVHFPVIDDIGLPGMGEMEGHYQPVLYQQPSSRRTPGPRATNTTPGPLGPGVRRDDDDGFEKKKLGQLKAHMLHEAYETEDSWRARHLRYAVWEAGMNRSDAWPEDPVPWRQAMKRIFRALPCRPLAAFCHCYLWKRGFLDGRTGWAFAADRYRYYRMVAEAGR